MRHSSESSFDLLLTKENRKLSATFWTPEEVVQTAIDWLKLDAESKVLDIGSGVGKFCLLAAEKSEANFTGIEIRKHLVEEAKRLQDILQINNCKFIHSDIKEIDFQQFNTFFYYNSFCEHLAINEIIDSTIELKESLQRRYEDFLFQQFENLAPDSKIITYFSGNLALPSNFELIKLNKDNTLALWSNQQKPKLHTQN